jgi:hypothetical protein
LTRNTAGPDLLERTVELALEQLRRQANKEWDGESSAFDAVLYGRSEGINSARFRLLNDLSGDPILQLDSTSRVAFVLHQCARVQAGKGGCEGADGRERISRAVAKNLRAIGIVSLSRTALRQRVSGGASTGLGKKP